MERLVHDRLLSYVSDADLLHHRQSGFRKRHSTGTCLIEFLDAIYRNMDEGRLCGVLFLDLKKAFDTVDHNIAIRLLSQLNLSSATLDWFTNYLTNRKQLTKVNNVCSDIKPINCGVPQGSILGPLIFILYMNSLPNVLTKSETYLYADDTAIICTGNSIHEINETMRSELACAATWMRDHRLSLNYTKTKVMYYGTSHALKQINDTTLQTGRSEIEIVKN